MSDATTIVLSALGGYGGSYLSWLLDGETAEPCRLVAGVEPFPERCDRLDDLKAAGVGIYDSLEAFYADGGTADLAVLAPPIHYHCPQTCLALEHRSHVLCEKPLCATVQEADRMIAARDAAGLSVAIGYQWSYGPANRALMADIGAGLFGAPKRMKTLCLAPRDQAYYGRNNWAGRLKAEDGRWVLDSPVNNSVAHFLHNMFHCLGGGADASDPPAEVTAELYRANPIENYDTAALRARTAGGVEVLFYAAHACIKQHLTTFCFEFEDAEVRLANRPGDVTACFPDGRTKVYGDPGADPWHKLWNAVRAARDGERVLCSIEAARAHTLCMNGAQESAGEIVQFPADLVRVSGKPGARSTWVEGLAEVLHECYDKWALPSERGVPWSRAGRAVSLTDYRAFPQA